MGSHSPDPTIRWILHRHGLSVVCETVPDGSGFDVVLTLRGHVIERQICASVPGSETQVTAWRELYEAHGWSAGGEPHGSA